MPGFICAQEINTEDRPEADQKVFDKLRTTDWSQLHFNEERQIKAIKLVCRSYDIPESKPDTVFFEVKSSDPHELSYLEGILRHVLIYAPVTGALTMSGDVPWAELHILDQNGKTTIVWVFPAGFCIEEMEFTSANRFHSWALASFVNDLYEQGCKRPLPKQIFDRLSGQAEIEDRKNFYEQHEADMEWRRLRRQQQIPEKEQRRAE